MQEDKQTFLDKHNNPFFGGMAGSNFVEGTVVKVQTDDANNVTFTADVVTIKNEFKQRVPLLFPYASADGQAGLFVVPNVGDKCLIGLAAGNTPYIVGFHPAVEIQPGRASAALAAGSGSGAALKGTFANGRQLIPGAIEMRTPFGNRIMVHPGGSVAIDSRQDLFSFWDAVAGKLTHFCRSYEVFSAGGQSLWEEGDEPSKRSMSYAATLYTKSATKENVGNGPLRGGAKMSILFGEKAKYFLLDIVDENGIDSKIAIGPGGIILTSGDGTNQASIVIGPSGNFSFIGGDPAGLHTEMDISGTAIAMTAFDAATPIATVQASTDGSVKISSEQQVTIDAPQTVQQNGLMALGGLGGMGVVRTIVDKVQVFGVQSGPGSATGFAITGSTLVKAGG